MPLYIYICIYTYMYIYIERERARERERERLHTMALKGVCSSIGYVFDRDGYASLASSSAKVCAVTGT